MVIFSDGGVGSNQETAHNFATWSGSSGSTVVNSDAHHGDYSFLNDGASDRFYINFAAGATIYQRAYVKFTSLPTSGNSWIIFDMYAVLNSNPRAIIRNNAGSYEWGIRTGDGSIDYYAATVSAGVYYCIELAWVSATKTATMWVEGIKIGDHTTANADTVSSCYFGYLTTAALANYDCCVIDSVYIACEGVGGVTVKKGSNLANTMTTMLNSKMLFNFATRFPKLNPRQTT